MVGIFNSIDLKVLGEESGARVECKGVGVMSFGADMSAPDLMYLIPFESDGYTIFNTYTVHFDITPTDPGDEYRYVFAVYRQYGKLSDVATATGVGELVPNSTITGPTWSGVHSMKDTTQITASVTLPQGSYFIALSFETIGSPAGPLMILASNMIDCATLGNSWITESHMVGQLAAMGTLPTLLTTADAALLSLTDTFLSADSCWAGIFYYGDIPP